MPQISAVIITFNEEKKIGECLASLVEVVDEIVVVDSFSTDRTEEICRQYNARFIKNTFAGYVAQKNFAMEQATYDHVLSLDADERLSEAMKEAVREVKNAWGDYAGYAFNRRNNYCGRWILHAWYPDRKIRLWDRTKGRWGGTDPHDTVIIPSQKVKQLKGDLLHYAYATVDEHLKQVNRFGELAARAKYKKGQKANLVINVFISPFFTFFKCYILKRGFLDGYYGLVFCLAASMLTFTKYLRLYEYNRRGLPEER